mgnify:CR=1 FL=1
MNFDFSDEQKMLRDQARRFLEDNCSSETVRAILDTDTPYDANLWKGLAEMGFQGAAIPEEFGGLGLGYLELCVIAEELGRAVAPVPFSSSVYLASEALLMAGSDAQKSAWLPKLASGEAIGCFATAEGNQPVSAKNLATSFDGSALTGQKVAVADGDIADCAIVLANGKSGAVLALVDLNGEGVERRTVRTVDSTRSHAVITFNKAPAELLGDEGEGWSLKERVFDRAAVLIAFEQIGGADAALAMAKDYTMERYAFGRKIASFQALKHKLADIYIGNELARSNAYYGAWALSTDSAELPIAAAGARASACDAYDFASQENIQAHGGIGYTWEADCQLHYKRARVLSLTLGSKRYWKDLLITRLEQKNAA